MPKIDIPKEERDTKHWSRQTPDPTQAELTAREYIRKVDALAEGAAEIQGRPYGTRDLDWDALVEAWNQRDPEVDEAQVWVAELAKAAQALEDDETLDRETVLAELPILVAQKVFPARARLVKESSGKTDYHGWTDFSDELEMRAAKARMKAAEAAPVVDETAEVPAAPVAAPAPTPPPVPAAALAPVPPVMPDPMRPGPTPRPAPMPAPMPGAPMPGAL